MKQHAQVCRRTDQPSAPPDGSSLRLRTAQELLTHTSLRAASLFRHLSSSLSVDSFLYASCMRGTQPGAHCGWKADSQQDNRAERRVYLKLIETNPLSRSCQMIPPQTVCVAVHFPCPAPCISDLSYVYPDLISRNKKDLGICYVPDPPGCRVPSRVSGSSQLLFSALGR